ncbi:Fur family transcriptional regulator [Fulvimonas soli]|jgi:Fur family zinc uptake transcriptional regulator|uniref:Fur family zinc uptake transcriptional regulator n=1 Tax=Fulvimonas soli TaxID=155197 RepID=A0A316IHM8_9GAMM|nr:transcriptional repressor [Fulvimonas soli]PWK93012.1 Fur family zinc uptake transcriptional regulator [Fulvimonas soli]TNY26412.1 hypothetical protein BV497_08895 [Fulvimonas soli]
MSVADRMERLVVAPPGADGRGMTPLRREVLQFITGHARPVKAYDLLDALRRRHPGLQPSSVYRALDFLIRQGLVRRLGTLRAYARREAARDEAMVVYICRRCRRTCERDGIELHGVVSAQADRLGFRPHGGPLEVKGLCAACAAVLAASG